MLLHCMDEDLRMPDEREAADQDERLRADVDEADDLVQSRRLFDADRVERGEESGNAEDEDEVDDVMVAEPRDQEADVADREPREKRDVDREVEEHGPT